MAVVRNLKHQQHQKYQHYKHYKAFQTDFDVVPAYDAWLGHPMDPIGILFDTLAEASLSLISNTVDIDNRYALDGYERKIDVYHSKNVLVDLYSMYNEMNEKCLNLKHNQHTASPERSPPVDGSALTGANSNLSSSEYQQDVPKYVHIPVVGSKRVTESYLCAAMTVAIIGLSQHRRAPDLESQRDKAYRQEERLLRKLLDIKLDGKLVDVLKDQARLLLKYGLLSDRVQVDSHYKNVPSDIAQVPGLARYMFGALLPHDPSLAYEIGLKSLK